MESLAKAFDQPPDSPEHRALAEDGWMGGQLITVRYRLGRLLNRNLFRESDSAVVAALGQYLKSKGYKKASQLVGDFQIWSALAEILQLQLNQEQQIKTRKSKRVSVLEAVLANPEISDAELAKAAKTTEKQIARIPDAFVIRKSWKHRGSR